MRVKKPKLRSRLSRSGAGSGSNSADGLNTRLKNCAPWSRVKRSGAGEAQVGCYGGRVKWQAPGTGQGGLRPTATWRDTASSKVGGKSNSGWRGRFCCCAARAPSSRAVARTALCRPGAREPPPATTLWPPISPDSFRGGATRPEPLFPMPIEALLAFLDAAEPVASKRPSFSIYSN